MKIGSSSAAFDQGWGKAEAGSTLSNSTKTGSNASEPGISLKRKQLNGNYEYFDARSKLHTSGNKVVEQFRLHRDRMNGAYHKMKVHPEMLMKTKDGILEHSGVRRCLTKIRDLAIARCMSLRINDESAIKGKAAVGRTNSIGCHAFKIKGSRLESVEDANSRIWESRSLESTPCVEISDRRSRFVVKTPSI